METALRKLNQLSPNFLVMVIVFFTQFVYAQVRTETNTCVSCRIFGSAGALAVAIVVLLAIFGTIAYMVRMVRKNNHPTRPGKL